MQTATNTIIEHMKPKLTTEDIKQLNNWAQIESRNSIRPQTLIKWARINKRALGEKYEAFNNCGISNNIIFNNHSTIDIYSLPSKLSVSWKRNKLDWSSLDDAIKALDGINASYKTIQSQVEATNIELKEALEAAKGLSTYAKQEISKKFWGRYDRAELKQLLPKLKAYIVEAQKQSKILDELQIPEFHLTFPVRKRKRELIAYIGPTNSGKTYQAFLQLKAASSGIYLAPLRLMAAEGWDRLNSCGVNCSLITGEERITQPGATHASSTIEMLDLEKHYHCAVIDEAQMIQDQVRGWAWTNAILGANADKVIIVGSPEIRDLLTHLAKLTGEPITVHELSRLTPLEISRQCDGLQTPEEGTALISFSRNDVLGVKEAIATKYPDSCAVIYGALSPEVRRAESQRFSTKEAPFLSATDAIGMGLNLPIKKIIFTTLTKWNGTQEVQLSNHEIRQIAGRAGRFGMHESGIVSAIRRKDLNRIENALSEPCVQAPIEARILPHMYMLDILSERTSYKELVELLTVFQGLPNFGIYIKTDLSQVIFLANSLKGLPLQDQLTLACCPIDTKSQHHMEQWQAWVKNVRTNTKANIAVRQFDKTGKTERSAELFQAEQAVKLLGCYKWLGYRYPNLFTDMNDINQQIDAANGYILNSLKLKVARFCDSCNRKLSHKHKFKTCQSCYNSRYDYWQDHDDDDGDIFEDYE